MPRPINGEPVIAVYPTVRGRTPRHFGLNVEAQTDADSINLWDWLVDSGAAVAREFHHDLHLRRAESDPERWSGISGPAEFENYRSEMKADPGGAVDWGNYVFDDEIPLIGIPNEIAGKLRETGIAPVINMAYVPTMFPRPLVRDRERLERAGDGDIDWAAAGCAYDYYFALIYHFVVNHGARFFAMVNEPEYRFGGFYLPAAFDAWPDQAMFKKMFIDLDDRDLWDAYYKSLAVQVGVLARIARCALDDVAEIMTDRELADKLQLWGPASANLDAYWPGCGQYLDCCDYHQYSRKPQAFRDRFQRAAALVRGTGKRVVISEFNRKGGEMGVGDMLFDIGESIELIRLLMGIVCMAPGSGPEIEATAFYHFHFPATHRNYKSLVYGDMNRVDWTGRDKRPDWAGMEFSPDEMQIRFVTPAYHMFRMLARMTGYDRETGTPYRALDYSLMFSDSSRILDITGSLRCTVVDQGDRVFVTILNEGEKGDAATIDVSALPREFGWAVVRRTALGEYDKILDETRVTDGRVPLAIAPRSLTQVILSNIAPGSVKDARIVEETFTPGCSAGLELWQTTRLRLIATVAGVEIDLTEHNVVWASDNDAVRAGPGGLIQKIGPTSGPTRIIASLADGCTLAEIKIAR